jgi:hypothetical protein
MIVVNRDLDKFRRLRKGRWLKVDGAVLLILSNQYL